jgi:hypothetical protein
MQTNDGGILSCCYIPVGVMFNIPLFPDPAFRVIKDDFDAKYQKSCQSKP